MEERITIEGTVLTVVFQNEENGYTVARIVADGGELITVVGCMPALAPGETLIATGYYTAHPSYGEQFTVEQTERRLPESESEMLNYLASGVIRGIGAATAQKIVERFGSETFDILENDAEQLQAIRGITQKRAREIGESFRAQVGLRRLLEFLMRYDLPVSVSVPLYRRFGADAPEAVRRDPYLLCGEMYGVPFSAADTIALSMGMDGESAQRVEAAILFELSHNEQSGGHVFLPREKLLAAAAELIQCSTDAAEKSLDDLIAAHRIVEEPVANVQACYPFRMWEAEQYVARRVEAMLADTPDRLKGVDGAISYLETTYHIECAQKQKEAVQLAAEQEILLLTGGPGTGKTTSVRGIVALFLRAGLDVLLCAPTGRAAKRMGELCGMEAQTIHRMLGMSWNDATGEVTFQKCEKEPLEADAVIVDETSMVDLCLMRALLAALRPGTRLVLVGDADQLPSVGAGNVFSDLLRTGRIATIALKDIFRQAEASAIVRNAHRINEGEVPDLHNAGQSDFFFLPRRDSVRLCETVVSLCQTRLPEKMGIAPDEIQVLSVTRKGACGTVELNRALQAALNPPSAQKREKVIGNMILREGDRVMQIRNDYDIVWQKDDDTLDAGIFNGDVGKIEQITPDGTCMTVRYDDRVATYTDEQFTEVEVAYATTVHKAQGSEYKAVIFAAAPAAPSLMSRSVLYTGITRARELLVIVGDDAVVGQMTQNERKTRRYSGLRWRIANGEAR